MKTRKRIRWLKKRKKKEKDAEKRKIKFQEKRLARQKRLAERIEVHRTNSLDDYFEYSNKFWKAIGKEEPVFWLKGII